MQSDARFAANLRNAQHSTGPRTEQGKATSSLNALKHGLTSKTVLLPTEDPAEYQAFAAALLVDFNPANATEAVLAQELIDLQWRLLRVSTLEARILSSETPDYKALNNISLHASRMKRQFSATLQEFKQIEKTNIANRKADYEKAAIIYRADVILERASTLDEHGFDFTVEQLEHWIHRQTAVNDANAAIQEAEYNELMADDKEAVDLAA